MAGEKGASNRLVRLENSTNYGMQTRQFASTIDNRHERAHDGTSRTECKLEIMHLRIYFIFVHGL